MNIIDMIFCKIGGARDYENDISAEEKIQIKSSRIQSQNEYGWRKKSISSQKIKGKKEIIRLGRIYVAYLLLFKQ